MRNFRLWRKMILGVVSAAILAGAAHAQTASYVDTPLMVVRFNQDRVYYQQPLYNAVSRALEAKPSVMFNIISLVPDAGHARANEKLSADAHRSTGRFVADMVKMGVPQSRIRVSYQPGPGITANEVHLFVE